MSHQTAVMYLGQIVEQSPTDELYDNPLRPYTKALFSAALPSHPDIQREEIELQGRSHLPSIRLRVVGSILAVPSPWRKCAVEVPQLKDMGTGHLVSCHLY